MRVRRGSWYSVCASSTCNGNTANNRFCVHPWNDAKQGCIHAAAASLLSACQPTAMPAGHIHTSTHQTR
jgi:hypothetical protein